MKVCLWNESSRTIGGGWSFISNLIGGLQSRIVFTTEETADLIFIPSSSMVTKTDPILELKKQGKKIVLRVDNATRDSRNRGAGMSRMKRLALIADVVIYQCQWAKDYLNTYLQPAKSVIIYNGVDTSIFRPDGSKRYFGDYNPVYLYSRFNRDETKRWEKAWYDYQMIQRKEPNAKLVIVGQFSSEIVQYNFDFFQNENVEYIGVIEDPYEMASVYRGCDRLLATYYNDCYSNTYQEFLACGGVLHEPDMTGGTPELIKNGVISAKDMSDKYLSLFEDICHLTETH